MSRTHNIYNKESTFDQRVKKVLKELILEIDPGVYTEEIFINTVMKNFLSRYEYFSSYDFIEENIKHLLSRLTNTHKKINWFEVIETVRVYPDETS